jgi:hypothetical protein
MEALMRHILPACPDCRLTGGGCQRCGGFGVLMDCLIDPRVRQMIHAWRDEPEWHRTARWRAERQGRPGFFQSRQDATAAAFAEAVAAVGPPTSPVP